MKLVHFPLAIKTRNFILRLKLNWGIFQISRKIAAHAKPRENQKPVVFFNASTRLSGLSQNAAFSMIASWGMQLAGVPVIHFACNGGMSHCVLGTAHGNLMDPPPCKRCIRNTERFLQSAPILWFESEKDPRMIGDLEGLSLTDLVKYSYQGIPLGKLVLPSLRWVLRRYNLGDDPITLYLLKEFIISAYSVAVGFSKVLNTIDPSAVVLFNGLLYPEAVARFVAKRDKVRVITHEVSFLPFSAFFTQDLAPLYPINIPDRFVLTQSQNDYLDSYLQQRYKGDFSMAGVRFWEEMKDLEPVFLDQICEYKDIVSIFTNVIFDTSQVEANTIFSDMFDWLDQVLRIAQRYPNTLFIVRAHPDEMRQGKESRENVEEWVKKNQIEQMKNVLFIGPDEPLSSYELIRQSKFVMVYNSSIGLEATLLGVPVLCAGKARYTQYPTVFYPDSLTEYEDLLTTFLVTDEIHLPAHFSENGRRFLFYQLYRTSLPFGEFLLDHDYPGYVQLRRFSWKKLLPGGSAVVDCLVNGILNGDEFIIETDQA